MLSSHKTGLSIWPFNTCRVLLIKWSNSWQVKMWCEHRFHQLFPWRTPSAEFGWLPLMVTEFLLEWTTEWQGRGEKGAATYICFILTAATSGRELQLPFSFYSLREFTALCCLHHAFCIFLIGPTVFGWSFQNSLKNKKEFNIGYVFREIDELFNSMRENHENIILIVFYI